MKKLLLILSFVFFGTVTHAQLVKTSTLTVTKSSSYWAAAEFGLTINAENSYLGGHFINGFKVGERFFTGIGLGLGTASNTYGDVVSIPIFAHVSYEFSKSKFSPYVAGNFGYNFIAGDGPIINPSAGLKINLQQGGVRVGIGIDTLFLWEIPALTMNLTYLFH